MKSYTLIRNGLHSDMCELIKNALLITRNVVYHVNNIALENKTYFGDRQSAYGFSIHSSDVTESLLLLMKPTIEQITSKKLLPAYSFSRIYCKGSTLKPHIDRESCEYSVTLCINNNPHPWSIFMDSDEVTLNAGDFVVYKGLETKHWRNDLDIDTEVVQVFLHYVDADGPYREYELDKRPLLGIIPEEPRNE